MNSAAAGPLYQFDGFVLDLTRGILSDAKGEELPLRRKSFDLLHLLVENRGRLLDRDTIGQAIWSDVTVTDDSITQCVGDIRRALGDREQRMLKTMRRRGYIFDANIAAPENLLLRDKPRAVQRSLLWWHGPGESEMPHTDANRPVIANWWFPRRGAI